MKTASIYDGGNLTELPKVLVMSNTSYSNHLIFLSFLTIGHQCHFTDLSRVCSPDFKKRDWEENRVDYQRISWGRNSCKIALGWQSGYNSHCSLELAIFWGMNAVTYSIITKIRLEGTSLVCPAQSRDNVKARWDCSGLCPIMFWRSLRMETDLIFIILLFWKNNFAVLHKIYVNHVSVSLSLILTNEISSTCKFNCEMMII